MSFRSLCNKTVNVSRQTRTSDGAGGYTDEWANAYTAVPCRIQPIGGPERMLYGRDMPVPTHKVFMDGKYTITEKDKLIFGTRVFEIDLVRKIDEEYHLQIDVRETDF